MRYPKKTRKVQYKKSSKSKAIPQKVKAYVDRAITRSEEIKSVVTTMTDLYTPFDWLPLKPYIQDPGCNCISLLEPLNSISQGTGQGDRIGNKIQVKSVVFRGYLYSVSDGSTGGVPTNVTMYIGKCKNSISVPTYAQLSALYQAGDTTFSPTDNNLSSLYRVNNDIFTIYKTRRFKIGGASPASGYVANNDYKALQRFSIDVTKYIPKNILYNDLPTPITNAGLYVWFVISNYNDNAITASYIPQVQWTAVTEARFTDS